MDAGRWPSLIAKDQVALAINTTFRGGYPSPRPRYLYRPITFNTQEEQTWFETQIYQGSFWYSFVDADNPALHPNEGCLVVSVGGRQWKIDVTKYTALEITPPDGRNNRYKNIVYFCQARQYLIIQDGLAAPIIWDGSQTRRAGVNEVPVGTIMQFGQGRVWVLKGDALFAGDIEGGPTSILSFTETTFLAGGGALNPSYLIGNVNGLAFIPQQDTSTGVGTLLVFGERGTTSVFAELPRDQWINGIQRMVLINIGGTGHRTPCQLNGDVWFRSADGQRSYRQARGQVDLLAQLPLSTELDPFFGTDTPYLLPYASSVYFDNRLLTTISPQYRNFRVSFPAIAACDFHILSSFGNDRKPCWDGVWTGENIYELVQGNTQRLFMPGIDSAGRNCLFEMLKTNAAQVADVADDGNRGTVSRSVVWSLDSGLLSFDVNGGGPAVQKRLFGGKYWLRNISGQIGVILQYRKDGESCYIDWVDHTYCSNTDLCNIELDANGCPVTWVAAEQYRSPVLLTQPDIESPGPDDAPLGAGNSGKPLNIGYEFQTRFTITGDCMLYFAVFECQGGFEKETPGCNPHPHCTTSIFCCEDVAYYSFTPTLPQYDIPPDNYVSPNLAAQNAIINYLGNNPGHTPTQIVNNIPLPPAVIGPALTTLVQQGRVTCPPRFGCFIVQQI